MIRVLLADDEPLVLIGLQGCWSGEAGLYHLRHCPQRPPGVGDHPAGKTDIVVADVKMPLMDGLTLARTCREKGSLPVFIILTSFEQFDYGARRWAPERVDYLVKLELTPESLTAALARAAERVKKERALMGSRLPLRHGRRTAQLPGQFLRGCTPGCFSRKRSWKRRCPVGGRPCGGPVSSGQL